MSKRTGWSLAEMLVVLAVLAFILPVISRFFADGLVGIGQALRRADSNQSALIIMENWQKTLRNSAPSSWKTDGSVFIAGPAVVKQDGKRLLVRVGSTEKCILLPDSATCRFSIERPPGMAACAVMTLIWPSRYLRARKMNGMRFVACGSRE